MKHALSLMLLAGVVVWLSAAAAQADNVYGTPRQYYSDYTYVPSHEYGYRTYYYKPTPSYAGYKHHYVIYPKHDHQHAYYYNPEKQVYWGRCPSQCHGQPLYSLLRPSQRRGALNQIPQGRFPTPGPLPTIPGAQDNTTLDLAPDNTPVIAPALGAAVTAGTPPVAGGTPPAVGVGQGPGDPPPAGIPTVTAPPPDAPPAEAVAAPLAAAVQ